MLGSLARKLRIFGFDTLYFREGSDAELERLALAEGRVIVTADGGLAEHSNRRGLAVLMVRGDGDRARLESLLVQARSNSLILRAGSPRCALCNSDLERVGRVVAEASLPAAVTARHRLYYRCQACRRLYWRGGHWRRLRRLSALVEHR